jgi:hypothetical protein
LPDSQNLFANAIKARKLERDRYDILMHCHTAHLRGDPCLPCTEALMQWRVALREYLDCNRRLVWQASDTRDASLLVYENPIGASQDEKNIPG